MLSSIPAFGRAFQGLSPFVLFPFLIVFPVWYVLNRTRWGLRLRSAGRTPRRPGRSGSPWPRSVGKGCCSPARSPVSPARSCRSRSSNNWREGQTLGLGFIALAALILSNWNPIRLMGAAFLFGFAQAVPLALRDAPIIRSIPEQFVNMTPYVVTIVVLAGFIGRVRPPAAAGRAYEGNDDLDGPVEPVAEVAEARQDVSPAR